MAAKRARAAEAKGMKKVAGRAPPKAARRAAPKAAKTAPKIAAKKAASKAAPSKAVKAAPTKAVKAAPMPAKAAAKTVKAAAKPVKAAPKMEKAAPKARPAQKAAKRSSTQASGASNGLGAGDEAPSLELADQDGNPFSLGDLRGSSYVLYFYPKDDTPGCTREACAFRDDLGKFERAKVRIIGVSPDKPETHTRFRTKYGLPFTLLSDVDKTAANAFGVWVKKQNYGREYMGIERSTFLVDESGKIKKVWHNVKVDGHAQAILAESE
jgi:peroxiredoxin Q/BCP